MTAFLVALAIPCGWVAGRVVWDCVKPIRRNRPATASTHFSTYNGGR